MNHTFSLLKQSTNLYLLQLIKLKKCFRENKLGKKITLKPSALIAYTIIPYICTLKETTWNLENAFFLMEEYTLLLFFKAIFKILTVRVIFFSFTTVRGSFTADVW